MIVSNPLPEEKHVNEKKNFNNNKYIKIFFPPSRFFSINFLHSFNNKIIIIINLLLLLIITILN